jgi:prepilin-type N-terminal cleavage/methylation domain-containing protein
MRLKRDSAERWPRASNPFRGFTLIELLIVIAIILILIAIALPNFLEASMRARVTRVQAEHRSFSLAMESYFQDFKDYPNESRIQLLTTPVAYMSQLGSDPFAPADPGRFDFIHPFDPFYFIVVRKPGTSGYDNLLGDFNVWTGYPSKWTTGTNDPTFDGRVHYQIRSIGPNKANEFGSRYAPTNGTVSNGDINWFGPMRLDRPYGPIAAP